MNDSPGAQPHLTTADDRGVAGRERVPRSVLFRSAAMGAAIGGARRWSAEAGWVSPMGFPDESADLVVELDAVPDVLLESDPQRWLDQGLMRPVRLSGPSLETCSGLLPLLDTLARVYPRRTLGCDFSVAFRVVPQGVTRRYEFRDGRPVAMDDALDAVCVTVQCGGLAAAEIVCGAVLTDSFRYEYEGDPFALANLVALADGEVCSGVVATYRVFWRWVDAMMHARDAS
jgi:hypothetical protein